jgi:NADH-quinone oxidoreductase subunit G
LDEAVERASQLMAEAARGVVLVSSWGSNEELASLHEVLTGRLASRFTARVKPDHVPQPGELLEDDILIMADKNPNRRAALALFPALEGEVAAAVADADLVLVWGEGVTDADLPAGARVVRLGSYQYETALRADVFLPISIQTERDGHYTNAQGVVTAFSSCFAPKGDVVHAEGLFQALAGNRKALHRVLAGAVS